MANDDFDLPRPTDAVPSATSAVLNDNSKVLDYVVNGEGSVINRVGDELLTLDEAMSRINWAYVGLFADGVTFTSKTDFAVDAVGTQWVYSGPYPFVATPGSVPSSPDYQVVHVASHTQLDGRNPADGSAHNADDVLGAVSAINANNYTLLTANDSDAVMAAIAAAGSRSVFIPSRDTPWDLDNIQLNDGQTVFGFGTNISLTTNQPAMLHANRSTIKGFNFSGSGKSSGFTAQDAISIISSLTVGLEKSRTLTSDVNFTEIGGSAWRVTSIVNDHEGNVLTNYNIDNCNIGVNVDTRAEYTNFGSGNVSECITGLRIKGGNSNGFGCVVSDCVTGVHLVAGGNDAHGQLNGVIMNHNLTRTVFVEGTANGFLFNGCQMFNGEPGIIELKDCHNVWFRNCVKQLVEVVENNCTQCGFVNSDMLDGIDNNPNFNGTESEVFYLDNNLPTGTDPTGVNGLGGGFLRLEQGATLTSVATGDSDLDWDTVASNAITANPNYTVQHFYGDGGAGTSNPFIRGDVKFVRMQGMLKARGQITLGKAGLPAWSADEVTIKVINSSGDSVGFFTPEKQASDPAVAQTIRYHFNGLLPREAVKVVVENNSGGLMTIYRHQAGTKILSFFEVCDW